MEDESLKSDKYSIPINTIISLYRPETVIELKSLLDDNGYYGRHKIKKKYSKIRGDSIIHIEIYLPNSIHTYNWPFKTMYNLTIGNLVRKINLKNIPAIPFVMNYLSSNKMKIKSIPELPSQLLKPYNSNDLGYYQYIVTTLVHAGLFGFNKKKELVFVLKNTEDVKEVYENLFNQDNYLL